MNYTYAYIITRYEYMGYGSTQPYEAILCKTCAKKVTKTFRTFSVHIDELIAMFEDAGIPQCDDCQREIGIAAYRRFEKDHKEGLKQIQRGIDSGTYKSCKNCKLIYPLMERLVDTTKTLLLTYCSVPCAVNDGMSEEKAIQQRQQIVYRCQGCKDFFPHEQITHREGDFGFTKLCPKCEEDPKYFCFFPFNTRLSMGLVGSEELANYNAVHDM